ncbi:MAG: dual specificity protein phosphatase family protein, partial [Colwellia sp.]|nr:dual specificity protein phosphatase family protein [Colwellia sp.]
IPIVTGIPTAKCTQITPEIYVGSQYRIAGRRKLQKLGIKGTVNLRVEFDDADYGLTLDHYCYLPTIDGKAPSFDQLNQAIAFINQIIDEGGKVYIHCAAGVGRAPTTAVAFFISQGLNLDEAVGLIKKSRPFINISKTQMEQLRRFEATRIKGQ